MAPRDPYANLNSNFTQRLQAFIEASNGLITPGSGFRTNEEQAALYNRFKAGVPGQARAAPPGKSKHNHGLAMDLKFAKGGQQWAHANAARFGLYFPMEDEPWHIQPAGIDSTTKSGMPGLLEAGIDPDDERASRLQQIMSIMVGGSPTADTPKSLVGNAGEEIPLNPANQRYLNSMFQGNQEFSPTTFTDTGDPNAYGQYALSKFSQYGWSDADYKALIKLWNKESGDPKSSSVTWNPEADNPHSSAAGIAQKMQSIHGAVEPTYQGQIDWGLNYILERYGSPRAALSFHNKRGWY